MKRAITFFLGLFVAVALALLVCSSSTLAQQRCQDFRALYHQTLMVNLISNEGDWIQDPDPIRGLLDLQPVTPTVQYIPGNSAYPSAVAGRYWDYQQKWDFGNGDTFTVGNYHASFPIPPGKAGMGTFNATGKIMSGTGIFEGATGTEVETGPYLTWITVDENGVPWLMGKYNAMVVIRVCTK
jgi:hypothetical protein